MTSILLIGKNGQVGWELQSTLTSVGKVIALGRSDLDLIKADAIRRTIRDTSPDIIVNAAGYTTVDKAEDEPKAASWLNTTIPGIMAEEAKRCGALLIHYSTDYVFDGKSIAHYAEESLPNPLNIYGESKLEGEQAIIATGCAYLILRTSWIYSARRVNFVLTILKLARLRQELAVVDDQVGSPTWARYLAKSTAEILIKNKELPFSREIYHLSAAGYTSRYNFARYILSAARKVSSVTEGWAVLRPTTTAEYSLPAARPLHVATSKEKIGRKLGITMPSWEHQLDSCMEHFATSGVLSEIIHNCKSSSAA